MYSPERASNTRVMLNYYASFIDTTRENLIKRGVEQAQKISTVTSFRFKDETSISHINNFFQVCECKEKPSRLSAAQKAKDLAIEFFRKFHNPIFLYTDKQTEIEDKVKDFASEMLRYGLRNSGSLQISLKTSFSDEDLNDFQIEQSDICKEAAKMSPLEFVFLTTRELCARDYIFRGSQELPLNDILTLLPKWDYEAVDNPTHGDLVIYVNNDRVPMHIGVLNELRMERQTVISKLESNHASIYEHGLFDLMKQYFGKNVIFFRKRIIVTQFIIGDQKYLAHHPKIMPEKRLTMTCCTLLAVAISDFTTRCIVEQIQKSSQVTRLQFKDATSIEAIQRAAQQHIDSKPNDRPFARCMKQAVEMYISFVKTFHHPVCYSSEDQFEITKKLNAWDMLCVRLIYQTMYIEKGQPFFSDEDLEFFQVSRAEITQDPLLLPCFAYALLKKRELKAKDFIFYTDRRDGVCDHFLTILNNWGYRTVNNPQSGDLVVYLVDPEKIDFQSIFLQ